MMRLTLTFIPARRDPGGETGGRTVQFTLPPGGSITIGRADQHDLVLQDGYVSRDHAVITRQDQGLVLTDRKSKDGTRLGGRWLVPEEPTPLAHGDVIGIGDQQLLVGVADITQQGGNSSNPNGSEIPREGFTEIIANRGAGAVPQAHGSDAAGSPECRRLLSAAGLSEGDIDEIVRRYVDLPELLGALLRLGMDGLCQALEARRKTRQELRLEDTELAGAGNNPLKFAVSNQALRDLLLSAGGGYLEPRAAVSEALSHLLAHQLAMVVGMQAGVRSVFEHFDPQVLMRNWDQEARSDPIGFLNAGNRNWSRYQQHYGALLSDQDLATRRLFGIAFEEAYRASEAAKPRRNR